MAVGYITGLLDAPLVIEEVDNVARVMAVFKHQGKHQIQHIVEILLLWCCRGGGKTEEEKGRR